MVLAYFLLISVIQLVLDDLVHTLNNIPISVVQKTILKPLIFMHNGILKTDLDYLSFSPTDGILETQEIPLLQ